MQKVTPGAFARAKNFIFTHGRPLEQALFACHFERAGLEPVYTELGHFQNPDGGFGHALEPDVRTPASSALPTAIALRLLSELDCPAEHPLVRDALDFLLEAWDAETHVWRAVAAGANDYPHAPWWHDENGSLSETFDGFRIIPRVLILVSLWHYAAKVDADWLEALTAESVAYIERVTDLGQGGGGSDIEYAILLASAPNLPRRYADRLKRVVYDVIPKVVEPDPSRWHTYCITPLRIAKNPGLPGAELITEAVQAHLDYQIERQSPDGSWRPTWTWGGAYPEHWAKAEVEWAGQLTLEMLLSLRAYGRLEKHNQYE